MTQAQPNNKYRFLRVNPFRGLLVDENTWADAHDYHRNQMKVHLLSLHGIGIVQGLEVVASQPPDSNVFIRPGLAIDPEGRMLLLSEQRMVTIPPPAGSNTVLILLEFSERATQMQNVTEGGKPQAARILEECQVRVSPEPLPGTIELARVNLDANNRQIRNPASTQQAGPNELDFSGRKLVSNRQGAEQAGSGKSGRSTISVGVVRYGPPNSLEWKRHSEGVRRLLRDTGTNTILDGNVLEGINLQDEQTVRGCKVLYMTGQSAFKLSVEEEQAIQRFLGRGGVLWCEPCRNGLPSGTADGFSHSFLDLATKLGRKPTQPKIGHPLFTSRYLFAAAPLAIEPKGVVLESNGLMISTGDYGCLWEGRGQEQAPPPAREVLRSAQEFGTNALFMAMGLN